MTNLNRRGVLGAAAILAALLVVGGASAQDTDQPKPEIKRSEIKPVIMEYVEKMSQASKETTGVEFTFAQKAEMASSLLRTMEAQNIYAFVDP